MKVTTANCIRRLAVLALLAVSLPGATAAQSSVTRPPAEPSGGDSYLVFISGRVVGREELSVTRQADGWVLRGSSRLNPPVGTVVRHVEVVYDGSWHPRSLELDGSVLGKDVTLKTTFTDGKAVSAMTEGGAATEKTDDVSADAVVLPNVFFGGYAALSVRLLKTAVGGEIHAYVAPQGEIPVVVTAVAEERIETPKRKFVAKRYTLTFKHPAGDVAASLWAEAASGAFVRLSVPTQMLEVAREDVASAASRMTAFSIPGDESVRVAGNGFNIAATVTKPTAGPAKLPSVVIIGGAGPADRDGTVAGIPMLGQIAKGLVDAGYMVVRYDKRGIGQSGGRAETATLSDYTEDARAVVNYVRKSRTDADPKRIAVLGHSEGAWVALQLGATDKNVAAVVTVAGASGTGGALVLEQQQHLLDLLKVTPEEKKAKADLQARINDAATGKGLWDGVPDDLRKQADTPWFSSYLAFEPAKVLKNVRQPLLIVQGELDRQVAPRHADALLELAKARKRQVAAEVVMVPGVNHLLVPATSGEVSEYATLADQQVSAQATAAVAAWLTKTMPPGTK
ncbi:MAG: alpha/beta fold hydrolase [Acidobacteriota bacterium]